MLLLLLALALAEGARADEPAPPPPPAEAAEAEALEAPIGEELEIFESPEVIRRRAEVYSALKAEGYRKGRDRGDHTVFLPKRPWGPRVIVYDDGFVVTRRQPPRIHAPGRSFADEGSPAAYLLCIIVPTACVSIGGWTVSPAKLDAKKEEVLDATHDEVRQLNDAVARRALAERLDVEIPDDLARIWARPELSPEERRVLLYTYWDTRTDTPEGRAAQGAIRAFLIGEVQQSDAPFTRAELQALNARRQTRDPLVLPLPGDG